MFGDPIKASSLSSDAIILRPDWQYAVKRDGTRRSRLCCNGSKRTAPKLHAMTRTWSSCVELPIQRLLLALCASKGLRLYGADVVDVFGHSLNDCKTYLSVDHAYIEWAKEALGISIDKSYVLPIKIRTKKPTQTNNQNKQHLTTQKNPKNQQKITNFIPKKLLMQLVDNNNDTTTMSKISMTDDETIKKNKSNTVDCNNINPNPKPNPNPMKNNETTDYKKNTIMMMNFDETKIIDNMKTPTTYRLPSTKGLQEAAEGTNSEHMDMDISYIL